MAEKNTILITMTVVIVVAVVIVAGAFVLTNNDDDKKEYVSSDNTGRLLIMGNANHDDYLNNDDVEALEELLDKVSNNPSYDWKAESRLADANNDGSLTSADLEMVKKMVNREQMTINYAYLSDGVTFTVGSVSYPIVNYLGAGDDTFIALQAIGAISKCKGATVSDFDDPIYSCLKDITQIGSKSTAATLSLATTVADKDSVLITAASSRYITNESEFTSAGIPVIRMNLGTGVNGDIAANYGILTIGYLLGYEDLANEYVKFSDEVQKKVASVITGSYDTLPKSIVANRTANISGKSSEYYYIAQLAGAQNMIDYDVSHTSFKKASDDWLYSLDVDYIFHFTSLGFGSVDKDSTFTTYSNNFTETDAYKAGNYYLFNANMPTIVCVAMVASILYGDELGEDYGTDILTQYLDKFTCLKDTDTDVDDIFVMMKSTSTA